MGGRDITSKLAGKAAAVTGAASGIGLECAQIMIEEGAKVVLVDHAADKLARLCEGLGSNAHPLALDLFDGPAVDAMDAAIEELIGPLDIFHANAGAYVGGAPPKVTPMCGIRC